MYVIYVSEPLEKPFKLCGQRERKADAAPFISTANPALLSVLENAPISLL